MKIHFVMTSGINRVLIQVQISFDWSVFQNQPTPSPAKIWTKYVLKKRKEKRENWNLHVQPTVSVSILTCLRIIFHNIFIFI